MVTTRSFELAHGIRVGGDAPPIVIAGPCVAESLEVCRRIAGTAAGVCRELGLPYIFKASFDKANRTSGTSFRGRGVDAGLAILAAVKAEFGIPVLTDIHESSQAAPVAAVVDVLQIPAFLCRQTDLLVAAGETGRPVNIKKGQFMAPEDMGPALRKVEETGNSRVLLTERGSTFGYHNLVVDMRSLVIMAELGAPVVFDGTHSVQLPGGQGGSSGGQRQFIAPLVRAAAAVGVAGLFLETHPEPAKALSDGANSLSLEELRAVLTSFKAIHEHARAG
jgi:2-dehydro-3-deoxyphosphooctonate aldolase (KDO 8-P synthase)